MSYICDDCKKTTEPKQPCNKLVTETRPKTYVKQHKDKAGFVRETRTHGTEIVKELKLCTSCYTLRTGRLSNDQTVN